MRNYLTFWAARSERENLRDHIIISTKEPMEYYIDSWVWDVDHQYFTCPPNATDLNIAPGTKQKVKVFIQPDK